MRFEQTHWLDPLRGGFPPGEPLVLSIASANTATNAETRVWAFDLAGQAGVGVEPSLTLELHQGCAPTYDELASDSLLATREGGGSLWSSRKSRSAVEIAFGHWKKHGSEFPEF